MKTAGPLEKLSSFGWKKGVLTLLPVVVLGVLVTMFVQFNPIQELTGGQPPVEKLSVQRHNLQPGEIQLKVVNSGPQPLTIAQVQVNEAYWSFAIEPSRTIDRLEEAKITIPFHWTKDEPHEVRFITSTGATFDYEIEVATQTPIPTAGHWWTLFWIGAFVGIIPVGLGLMWLPVLQTLGRKGMNFILALTLGLLVFLLVDTVLEGLEIAETIPEIYQAVPLLIFSALLSFLALVAVSRSQNRSGKSKRVNRLWLATAIAIGIGFHNLGEGMAIGASIRLGEAALGSFLVIGFALHNLTEGVGIGAPMAEERPGFMRLAGLTLVAGGPAILGVWVGSFAYSPLLAVVFLSVGAGAIAQVLYEIGKLLLEEAEGLEKGLATWVNLGGITAGLVLMYVTALLVKF